MEALQEYMHRISAERAVAWIVMELCGLGAYAWRLFCAVYPVYIPQGRLLWEERRPACKRPVCHIVFCLLFMDFFPGREHRRGRAGCLADRFPFCGSWNPADIAVDEASGN